MATSTDKLAPRIIINEHDNVNKRKKKRNHPITLIFGFSPMGRTCEMIECNRTSDIMTEFGTPLSAPEKYFIDAGLRLVEQGSTVLMTRLPYDNEQSHTVKYVDYKLESPIAMKDIITVPQESEMRKKDDDAVTILKEMHNIDQRLNQVQRISQISDSSDEYIHSMTNEQLVELELDPQSNLEANTFRIVDIKGHQYGVGAGKVAYSGIFPVITTAPMALYYQGYIKNTKGLDKALALMDLTDGI
jgi:hypothetical protein